MAKAGDYSTRLEWLKRGPGNPDTFGQREETWIPQGYLWGAVENVVAARVTESESEKQETSATIRLRNYPAVGPGDKLREVGSGAEWTVETAVEGENEIECEVSR